MTQKKIYLAIDLGAGSGRVLAGEFDGQKIELVELNRFENTPVQIPSGWHWNTPGLYQSIIDGLKLAAKKYGDAIVSIGIDTWGVDYGLLDKEGRLIGLPYQYRDNRTDGMMELAYEKVGKREIYSATGIQFMFFNSLYQLLAEVEQKNPALEIAEDILFMPDLLAYWLTAKKAQELSIASTTQLYNPTTMNWDYALIEKLGIPKRLFKPVSNPGDTLGKITDAVQTATGLTPVQVISVASHDTASAVAAVPSQSETPAYLSSGTWSLIGLELKEPVINEQSFNDAFTNEVGVGGTIRFLKNICGLWLIQESRRYWQARGEEVEYEDMAPLAAKAEAFRSLINPDDPLFAKAGPMPERIQDYCRKRNQPVPETKGQIIRCIYESLAIRCAQVWDKLIQYAPDRPNTLHIVGGGCQDKLLNQFIANAINIRISAGPVEATGLGNILVQLLADGCIENLAQGRKIIAQSTMPQIFEPTDPAAWAEAKSKFPQ